METHVVTGDAAAARLVEEKRQTTHIASDSDSHLVVCDQLVCRRCILRPCVNVCPGGVYHYSEAEALSVAYENCLECGTCRIVCEFENIDWSYPSGGFGVAYSHG